MRETSISSKSWRFLPKSSEKMSFSWWHLWIILIRPRQCRPEGCDACVLGGRRKGRVNTGRAGLALYLEAFNANGAKNMWYDYMLVVFGSPGLISNIWWVFLLYRHWNSCLTVKRQPLFDLWFPTRSFWLSELRVTRRLTSPWQRRGFSKDEDLMNRFQASSQFRQWQGNQVPTVWYFWEWNDEMNHTETSLCRFWFPWRMAQRKSRPLASRTRSRAVAVKWPWPALCLVSCRCSTWYILQQLHEEGYQHLTASNRI